MLLILPASKTLDFEAPHLEARTTQPEFLEDSARLVAELRALSQPALAKRMALSDKLAGQVFNYFQDWKRPFTPRNAKPALLAYAGDLYDGLGATTLTKSDLHFAQAHVRILSGLYGLLRPLDLMRPYRLEMGARMAAGSLYTFWGERLTEALNRHLDHEKALGREPVLLNLASEEYAKAIHPGRLRGRMITPVFQEGQADRYKVVSFFAKRARGTMARFIIRERLADPEKLRHFREDRYRFAKEASSPERWIFRREVS
jgi:hypothetical protein